MLAEDGGRDAGRGEAGGWRRSAGMWFTLSYRWTSVVRVPGPELDYAFLADYAVVQAGKLTVVGASYTVVMMGAALPTPWRTTLAGRIRATADCESVRFGIAITAPSDEYRLNFGGELSANDNAQRYDGKIGLLFAASIQMPIVAHGLYTVDLALDDVHVRTLKFETMAADDAVKG